MANNSSCCVIVFLTEGHLEIRLGDFGLAIRIARNGSVTGDSGVSETRREVRRWMLISRILTDSRVYGSASYQSPEVQPGRRLLLSGCYPLRAMFPEVSGPVNAPCSNVLELMMESRSS